MQEGLSVDLEDFLVELNHCFLNRRIELILAEVILLIFFKQLVFIVEVCVVVIRVDLVKREDVVILAEES